jgi:hypothetical protein
MYAVRKLHLRQKMVEKVEDLIADLKHQQKLYVLLVKTYIA